MNILIVGSTGLVGQGVLKAALAAADVQKIGLLVRREMPAPDPRAVVIEVPQLDAANLSHVDMSGFDACLYCAGALPVGMSERDYRVVTVDITSAVASAYAKANPAGRFVYVSGAGANPRSRLMPLKIKGEAEQSLANLQITVVSIRPGVVIPAADVKSPHFLREAAYRLGTPLLRLASKLSPRVFTTTEALGRAMVQAARAQNPPSVIENSEIQSI